MGIPSVQDAVYWSVIIGAVAALLAASVGLQIWLGVAFGTAADAALAAIGAGVARWVGSLDFRGGDWAGLAYTLIPTAVAAVFAIVAVVGLAIVGVRGLL